MRSTELTRLWGALRLLSLLLFWTTAVPALEADREQPIQVAADAVDIDEATGVSVYQGDVQVDQGSIRIRADKVTVTQRNGAPGLVVAEGKPVTFQQQPEGKQGLVKGRALRTEYNMDSELLVMIGDALLIQGEDTFKSDRIVYDRAKSVVKAGASASGKERVHISIQPRKTSPAPAPQ